MENPPKPSRLNFSLDYRIIIIILLAIIAGMLAIWRPWQPASGNSRTISVTGQATIKAEPDEYRFTPAYEFKNADKSAALADASAKQKTLLAELKALGVADKDIKADLNSYLGYDYSTDSYKRSDQYTYTLNLTITTPNRTAAQKVEDYLATTEPTGAITPYATFSESLRNKLESQARDAATKDARAKADQSAKNLGFRVGHVKAVKDGAGFTDGIIYGGVTMGADISTEAKPSAPSVQPGQNDLNYSVSVEYYIR